MGAPPARLTVEFNAALEISAITFLGCWFRPVVALGLSLPSTILTLSPQGLPEADLPTMSTPWILYRLYKLDISSAGFLRHLHSLIRYDEAEQYLTGLRGSELARLVDFLGEVHTLPSALCPVTKRALQTLSAISADDDVSQQCLHKLQVICAHRATLPSSYIISDDLVRVVGRPIALGEISDVWEGTYRRRRVHIKTLKAPLNGDQTLKVCIRCGTSLSRLLKNTCGPCSHSSKRSLCGKG